MDDFIPDNNSSDKSQQDPDSKVDGDNMRPTYVLSAPSGPHVGPMNLAIRRYMMHVSVVINSIYA